MMAGGALRRGRHEGAKKRMRAVRTGAELRVELRAQHPRMQHPVKLGDLDQPAVGRKAEKRMPAAASARVAVVELPTVAMALTDAGLRRIRLGRKAAGRELAGHRPRRIVPPMSSMPCWSGIRLITALGVFGLNSVLLHPRTPGRGG